jgi:MYXO-CTERM domain-containing protein
LTEADGNEPGDYPCPQGEILRFGKCIPAQDDGDGDKSGGCSAAGQPGTAWVLLLLLVGMLAVRRRTRSV